MEELDIRKYDITSTMELRIETITNHYQLNKGLILFPYPKEQNEFVPPKYFEINEGIKIPIDIENQNQFILTIISILYKLKCQQKYLKENIVDLEQEENIATLYDIMNKLSEQINKKDIEKATRLVNEMGTFIQIFLKKYFDKKNSNYISEKNFIKYIIEQKNQHECLNYNPFMINQLLEYIKIPLTEEETTIGEILDYEIEARQAFNRQEKILRYIKKLMRINNEETIYLEKIAFIISNAYQEIYEDYNDPDRGVITRIIENEKIKKEIIINEFQNNDEFSNIILRTFLLHNKEIEEGHLEELKTKKSKQYAKRIYNK